MIQFFSIANHSSFWLKFTACLSPSLLAPSIHIFWYCTPSSLYHSTIAIFIYFNGGPFSAIEPSRFNQHSSLGPNSTDNTSGRRYFWAFPTDVEAFKLLLYHYCGSFITWILELWGTTLINTDNYGSNMCSTFL